MLCGFRVFMLVLFVFERTVFLTELQGGYAFTRVENARWIKGRLHIVKLLQLLIVELNRHLANLLHAHTVLTGNAASDLHAHFQDAGPKGFCTLEFPGYVPSPA